jgi:hypothetical protein
MRRLMLSIIAIWIMASELFAVDSAVSPGGVLPGQAQDQAADRTDRGWPSGLVGPGTPGVLAGDQVPVPAQHGLRADQ